MFVANLVSKVSRSILTIKGQNNDIMWFTTVSLMPDFLSLITLTTECQ